MKGQKVYFYNTSIGGMLQNTENFLFFSQKNMTHNAMSERTKAVLSLHNAMFRKNRLVSCHNTESALHMRHSPNQLRT